MIASHKSRRKILELCDNYIQNEKKTINNKTITL
jgi:hypothetical protein